MMMLKPKSQKDFLLVDEQDARTSAKEFFNNPLKQGDLPGSYSIQ